MILDSYSNWTSSSALAQDFRGVRGHQGARRSPLRSAAPCGFIEAAFAVRLLQRGAAGERFGDGRADEAVRVGAGVEADRAHLVRVRFAVRQSRLLDRAVDDLPDDVAVGLVHREEFAFKDEREFVHDGRVDEGALRGREPALRDFAGGLVSARDSEVVAGYDCGLRSESDGESLALFDVRPGFVGVVDADRDSVLQRDAAPRGVHDVGRAILVVRPDHEHGHWEKPVLGAEVLFHRSLLVLTADIIPQAVFDRLWAAGFRGGVRTSAAVGRFR